MDPKTGEVAAIDKTQAAQPIEEKKVEKSPRLKAIEEIAKRVELSRKDEIESTKFDELTEDGQIIAAPESEPVEEETPPVEEAMEEAPAEETKEQAEEMREIIVDGKKMMVPMSKILDAGVRTFQKETAADMRLAAAAELERQAMQKLHQVAPPPQRDVQQQFEQPSDEDAALAKAIQFGSEEEAKAAIAKLRSSSRGSSQQELRQFVNGALNADIPQHLAFYEANRWVKNEYKEIFSDPDLSHLFMQKEEMARRSGDQRPFTDLYKEIAEGMSQKFNLRKATDEIAKAQNADRVVRKANAPKVPSSAAGRQERAPEKKQQSVTDYVQRQRELRGLTPMPRNQQGI